MTAAPRGEDANPAVVVEPERAVTTTTAGLPALATMSESDFEVALEAMKKTRERLKRVHKEVMTKDVDYGVIPGTNKPTLLKPGAEILFKMNRCTPRFERQRSQGDGVHAPHILWDSTCLATDADGVVIAEGSGSCNSFEKKYRYRNADRKCPECGATAIIKSAAQYGGGFVCWKKRDGCGAKFGDDDAQITEQMAGQVENPDPYEQENTLKKMADKRAMVACALSLQAASGSFTQDLDDDLPPADDGPPAEEMHEDAPAADHPRPASHDTPPPRGLDENDHPISQDTIDKLCHAAKAASEASKAKGSDIHPFAVLDTALRNLGYEPSAKGTRSWAAMVVHLKHTLSEGHGGRVLQYIEDGAKDIPF